MPHRRHFRRNNASLDPFSVEDVRSLAREYLFRQLAHDQDSHIITFRRHTPKYSVLIRVHHISRVIETRFIHPINGPTLFFQRQQSFESLKTIFQDPRLPPAVGSYTRYGLLSPSYGCNHLVSLVPIASHPEEQLPLIEILRTHPITAHRQNPEILAKPIKTADERYFGYLSLIPLLLSYPDFVTISFEGDSTSYLNPPHFSAHRFRFEDLASLAAIPARTAPTASLSTVFDCSTPNRFALLNPSAPCSSSSTPPPLDLSPLPEALFSEQWGRHLLYSNLDMCAYYCSSLLARNGYSVTPPHAGEEWNDHPLRALECVGILVLLCEVYRERSRHSHHIDSIKHYQIELELLQLGYSYVEQAHQILILVGVDDFRGMPKSRNIMATVTYCLDVFGRHLRERYEHVAKEIARLQDILDRRMAKRNQVRDRCSNWKQNPRAHHVYAHKRLTLKEQIAEAEKSREGVASLHHVLEGWGRR